MSKSAMIIVYKASRDPEAPPHLTEGGGDLIGAL